MATIRQRLQKEIFDITDERLVDILHVTKPGKRKKKISFLCATKNKDKPVYAYIHQVKETEKDFFKKKVTWPLLELQVVDGKDEHKETPELDLTFDRVFKWIGSSVPEKNAFIQVLWKLCCLYLPKQKPQFVNISPGLLKEDILQNEKITVISPGEPPLNLPDNLSFTDSMKEQNENNTKENIQFCLSSNLLTEMSNSSINNPVGSSLDEPNGVNISHMRQYSSTEELCSSWDNNRWLTDKDKSDNALASFSPLTSLDNYQNMVPPAGTPILATSPTYDGEDSDWGASVPQNEDWSDNPELQAEMEGWNALPNETIYLDESFVYHMNFDFYNGVNVGHMRQYSSSSCDNNCWLTDKDKSFSSLISLDNYQNMVSPAGTPSWATSPTYDGEDSDFGGSIPQNEDWSDNPELKAEMEGWNALPNETIYLDENFVYCMNSDSFDEYDDFVDYDDSDDYDDYDDYADYYQGFDSEDDFYPHDDFYPDIMLDFIVAADDDMFFSNDILNRRGG